MAEVLIVAALISVLAAISVPAMTDIVQKSREKSYVTETYLVRAALESYLTETSGNGPISDDTLYEKILYPHTDEKEHALYPMLADCCREGGRIIGVGYDKMTYEVVDIIYRAGDYEVEIKKGAGVRTEKIK